MDFDDVDVVDAMQRLGGSFIKALGYAASRADLNNLRRIKAAFPDYWEQYRKLAELKPSTRRASEEEQ